MSIASFSSALVLAACCFSTLSLSAASPLSIVSTINVSSSSLSGLGYATPDEVNTTVSSDTAPGVAACSGRMNGVLPPFIPTGFVYSGNTRQYYLQAEEVEWDYIPSGWDNMRGVPIDESPVAEGSDYIPSQTSIGHKYIKALFRGYTGSNYTTLSAQPDWLGFQGPLIRAEVGDMIEVMVYNNLKIATHPVSLHSMGLLYSPTSEGSLYYRGAYANGTAIHYGGDAIQPGECFVYKWLVPAGSAPKPNQPSKLWSYHGDVNLLYDVMSGLFGSVIVYHPGQMAYTMKTKKEFVMYYSTSDEYQSYYLNANVAKYLPNMTFDAVSGAPVPVPTSAANETVWGNIYNDLPPTGSNASLAQSFMVINGFAYDNMPTLQMVQDDTVIWHFWTMGSFNDGFHTAHFHGNNFVDSSGENKATQPLLPGNMFTVVMDAANIGLWQLLCHTAAHWQMGMVVNYNVSALPGTVY